MLQCADGCNAYASALTGQGTEQKHVGGLQKQNQILLNRFADQSEVVARYTPLRNTALTDGAVQK